VVPALDGFPPEERTRIALEFAPVARRARLPGAEYAEDPERTVAFWTRFWNDRSVEFRPSAVGVALDRLIRYGDDGRADELEQLDTFVLPAVFERLRMPTSEAELERTRILVGVAAHVTGKDDVIERGATLTEARACVGRWRAFWSVYESDFTTFDGLGRVLATVRRTRYGRAAAEIASSFVDPSDDDLSRRRSLSSALLETAYRLAGIVGGGFVLALVAALTSRRGSVAVRSIAALLTVAQPLSVALAAAACSMPASLQTRELAACGLLALGVAASPFREASESSSHRRGSLLARYALARGVGPGARFADRLRRLLAGPLVLLSLEPTLTLTGVFVVEHRLGLEGLAAATAGALERTDGSYFVGLAVLAGLLATVVVTATTIARERFATPLRLEPSDGGSA
jgi:hypothetical protein